MAGNLPCSPDTCRRHIGLLFGERLDTLFTSRIRKYPDSPVHTLSNSLRIYFFPLNLESGFIFFRIRCRIRRMRVDGSGIRKKKLRDWKISGYVWTGLYYHLREMPNSEKTKIVRTGNIFSDIVILIIYTYNLSIFLIVYETYT